MTNTKATELRMKQDFLLMLAVDMMQFPESFHVTDNPGSPTLAQLRPYVWPAWEHSVDHQISELANSLQPKVSVPDFGLLASLSA